MLQRSFVHLPGVGQVKERKLWEQGIRDWSALEQTLGELFKNETKREKIASKLKESQLAYISRDLSFFYKSLPRDHLWRMVPEFSDDIAYLDIESTGMGFPPMAHSTTITFYHRGQLYQEHDHAKKRALVDKMSEEASLWCTFFGEGFDVPFLRHEFGMELDVAHVDLCFWLKRLGYKGGLKKIQKRFSEIPARESLDIDGFDAVRLWRMHERGVPGALETLLTYNAEDTIVLELLLAIAFNLEVERNAHLGLSKMAVPEQARLSTRIHPSVYELLRPISDSSC